MARGFTPEQRALLKSPSLRASILFTFYLDEGTFRFCDDIINLSDGTNEYIGANPLIDAVEYRSGNGLSAEPVVLKCDANRMVQAGIEDPQRLLRDIMGYLHQQRRVDFSLGLSQYNTRTMEIILPLYAGKINYVKLVDPDLNPLEMAEAVGTLEIALDSLSMRYNRSTNRTRSHEDQLKLFPGDNFFSFVGSAQRNELLLKWGK